MNDELAMRRRRRGVIALGLLVTVVFGTTWLASSRTAIHDVGTTSELIIINDAGPVRVRSLTDYDGADGELGSGGAVIRTSESWLLRGPKVEMLTEGNTSAFRITCPNRLPCRATAEVFVPSGVSLSIVAANDVVEVDSFSGAMSIFAGEGGVALGAVDGSVSIASEGPVNGATLGPSQLTVEVVDGDVSLRYEDAPTVLAIVGGEGDILVELPPNEDYAIDVQAETVEQEIESDAEAERLVSVRSRGAVSVRPTDTNRDREDN